MPRRLYPDVNVVHLLRAAWTAEEFDALAQSADCNLTLGFHVVYELARAFLYAEHIETAKEAFHFLSDIERLDFLPTIKVLLGAEFHLAVVGVPLVTTLGPDDQVLIRHEILKLSLGHADNARRFISAREAEISVGHPQVAQANMDVTNDFLARNPGLRPQMRTFSVFRQEAMQTAPRLLRNLARQHEIGLPDYATDRVLADPNRFPVLNTWLNAQWHLAFIASMHGTVPSADRLDDYRHLVESVTCDALVTNDEGLQRRSHDIRFFRMTLAWHAFKPSFARGKWPTAQTP